MGTMSALNSMLILPRSRPPATTSRKTSGFSSLFRRMPPPSPAMSLSSSLVSAEAFNLDSKLEVELPLESFILPSLSPPVETTGRLGNIQVGNCNFLFLFHLISFLPFLSSPSSPRSLHNGQEPLHKPHPKITVLVPTYLTQITFLPQLSISNSS